jgi:uncharacterized damage-inducible protein DinB
MMTCKEIFVFTVDGVQRFHGWTHASLMIVLNHLSTIPASDYVKEVPGFGFSTLQKQLIHVFNCEELWIHALQKLEYVDRDPSEFPDVVDANLPATTSQRKNPSVLVGSDDSGA